MAPRDLDVPCFARGRDPSSPSVAMPNFRRSADGYSVRSTGQILLRGAAISCAAPPYARRARRGATLSHLDSFLRVAPSSESVPPVRRLGARAGGETPGMGSPVPRGTRIETLSLFASRGSGVDDRRQDHTPALAVPPGEPDGSSSEPPRRSAERRICDGPIRQLRPSCWRPCAGSGRGSPCGGGSISGSPRRARLPRSIRSPLRAAWGAAA